MHFYAETKNKTWARILSSGKVRGSAQIRLLTHISLQYCCMPPPGSTPGNKASKKADKQPVVPVPAIRQSPRKSHPPRRMSDSDDELPVLPPPPKRKRQKALGQDPGSKARPAAPSETRTQDWPTPRHIPGASTPQALYECQPTDEPAATPEDGVAAVSAQDWAAAAGKKVQVKSNKDEQFVLTLITTAVAIRMPEYHFLGKALQHGKHQDMKTKLEDTLRLTWVGG